jgi:uncharacterized Zn-binding protein involved in type VI secretion
MSVSVNPPKTPVTKGSNGVAAATVPNVCKMPGPPAPFVPTPLPNIGKSSSDPKGYSKKVKVEGKPAAIQGASFGSMGDAASKGTGGGLVSSNTHGPTKFIAPGSFDVKFEGKNVQQLGDQMLNNCGPSGAPANAATMMGEMQPPDPPGAVDELAPECPDPSVCEFAEEPGPGENEERSLDEARDHALQQAGSIAMPSQQRGFLAEARGIEHNRQDRGDGRGTLKEGKDTSVIWHCNKCGHDREVDQVLRDEDGKITGIVEVKSGGNLRGKQGAYHKVIAQQRGITSYKKVQHKTALKNCNKHGIPHFNMNSTPALDPIT